MSKQQNSSLLPELRFSEFSGEWEERTLSNVCDMQAGKFVRASEIKNQCKVGFYPCFGGNGLRGFTRSFTHKGTYSLIGRQGALCGNITLARGKFHATEHAVVVTPKQGVRNDWLHYILNYLNLNKFSTGQAQPGLSVENLNNVAIKFTPIEDEQKKIAACLASLDELITAHTQKFEALKTHKKGLMQQLFPAEGERVPTLRFPEFRESKGWVSESLGSKSVAEFVKDRVPLERLSLNTYVSTENLLPDFSGVTIASKLPTSGSFTQYNKSDVLISNIRPYLKKIWQATESGATSNDVIVIRAGDKVRSDFLVGILQNDNFINYVMKGVKMPRGDISSIREYPVAFPTPSEQQKIAACLASLDELITVQSQKIEALKTHKKGLMQQLFPAIDKVNA